MSKFKVGDRVVVVGIEEEHGRRGEVTRTDYHPSWPIEVRFDGGSLSLGLCREEELEFEHVYDGMSKEPLVIKAPEGLSGPISISKEEAAQYLINFHSETNLVSSDDVVNHPSHYIRNGFEVIEIIEAFELNFRLANVIKYVLRCDRKHDDNGVQDLKKALWYLKRELESRGGPDD